MELYNYKAIVKNVVDGDTIDVIIDLGFDSSLKQRLRLVGINAPELHSKVEEERTVANAAKQYLIEILLDRYVIINTEKADAFGRYLATVYLDGENVNQHMIEKGLAIVYKRKK